MLRIVPRGRVVTDALQTFMLVGVLAACLQGGLWAQSMQVAKRTIPEPGIDKVRIVMMETYDIEGVGRDTVKLEGTLVTRRGPALLVPGQTKVSWSTATVVAEFTSLDLKGESKVFGPVHVTLDTSRPTFAAVTAGRCAAAVNVKIEMPKIETTLHTTEAVQLKSQVTSVPPIGDEKTVSVNRVGLVDQSGRQRGRLESAQVMWRELMSQEKFADAGTVGAPGAGSAAAPSGQN